MSRSLIKVQNLGLQLGGRQVLDHISLDVMAGQFIALLGPNGAGKTSLLRCMAGLLDSNQGDIILLEQPLSEMSRELRSRSLAYLEQNADCHWPMLVEDVVALGRLPFRLSSSAMDNENRQYIDRALEESDLQSLRHRRVDGLSGGERRRVMLARTLATDAPLLLADEPIAGLDPAHQLHMMELLAARAASGVTVIIVLHDLALAARYCERLIMLERGRIVADGPASEVMTVEILAATYGIDTHIDQIRGLPVILPIAAR